ncbi:acetylcholinesterase collagenic tail peptide-like isoform X2 [Amphiprion ocellaris]|uniref:acetylcholinesterase collagenic tail peptide-like isoform X2 n=1 Tax=Amphiprion ocellaris TaxID=80972 RepID=UPI0024110BF8|nr:acetylcholinesterase collagenic tail peptide-like isoform X2 [Amphiprion ocellaris]
MSRAFSISGWISSTPGGVSSLPQQPLPWIWMKIPRDPTRGYCLRQHILKPLHRDKGEKGDRGWRGLYGDIGTPGMIKGFKGRKGFRGDKGVKGKRGLSGQKGEPGITAPPGEKGDPGQWGDAGQRGEAGSRGEPGARGTVGLKGPHGPTGQSGHPGPAGLPGLTGDPGLPGQVFVLPGLPGEPGSPGPAAECSCSQVHTSQRLKDRIQTVFIADGEKEMRKLRSENVVVLRTDRKALYIYTESQWINVLEDPRH